MDTPFVGTLLVLPEIMVRTAVTNTDFNFLEFNR